MASPIDSALDNYIDIRLLPDPEMPASVLMNSLFSKLHRLLVSNPELQIGVSFPALQKAGCGDVCRLHGSAEQLASANKNDWLGGLRGYLSVSPAAAVPATAERVSVRRKQAKTSPSRLARRYKKRHEVSDEEAAERYRSMEPKTLKLPFLSLRSESTGQHFKHHIQQTREVTEAVTGQFNRYGISQTANLPWF